MRRLTPFDEERDHGVVRHGQPPPHHLAGRSLAAHADRVAWVVPTLACAGHDEVDPLGTDSPAGQTRPGQGGDTEPARSHLLLLIRADELEVSTLAEPVEQVAGAHARVAATGGGG